MTSEVYERGDDDAGVLLLAVAQTRDGVPGDSPTSRPIRSTPIGGRKLTLTNRPDYTATTTASKLLADQALLRAA